MELKGSVAIVTGAGTGIGRGIAAQFAGAGIAIVCVGRRKHLIDETVSLVQKSGGRALAIQADVTDETETRNVAERALKEFGRIDVLFNNAGAFDTIGGVWEVDPKQWWNDVTIN